MYVGMYILLPGVREDHIHGGLAKLHGARCVEIGDTVSWLQANYIAGSHATVSRNAKYLARFVGFKRGPANSALQGYRIH